MGIRDPTFCREFVTTAKNTLACHSQLLHEWSIDADDNHCILDFPAPNGEGFPVTIEVYPEEITVTALGYHEHFALREKSSEVISDALALVRDLLSPAMRVREYLSSGTPYRWDTELLVGVDWRLEGTTGLFFWNYFGRRAERIYQNRILESRIHTG